MSNKTYNNLIALISFLATLAFIVGKILGAIVASWWFILVPWGLYVWFRRIDEDDDDYYDDFDSNHFKMA
jgi:uncharacterized iron-regulated membrane protein